MRYKDKTKTLVVGAGLSGSTMARLLKDCGCDVNICEQENFIGGLCKSDISDNGVIYEPFGARTFHTKSEIVRNFIQKFVDLNDYKHNKGNLYKNKLYHYPINYETIKKMQSSKRILNELENRPTRIDSSNFETAMLSVFGKTLYKMFIKNYSEKFWGISPNLLEAEWAPNRVELKRKEVSLFEGQWQGVPKGSYNTLFYNLTKGIEVFLNCDYSKIKEMYDLIIFSGKIDSLYNYKFGKLSYRSIDFTYKKDEHWENSSYGTINLNDHPKFFRKANFKILHQQDINANYIQYQKAVPEDENHPPMYPINTKNNNNLFRKYLKLACENDKTVPIGRLGLYKYLDMDKAILLSIKMKSLVLKWKSLQPDDRYKQISNLLKNI